HQELIQASLAKLGSPESCRDFTAQLIEAGRSVAPGRDREALRRMLYYWSAEAVGGGELRKDEPLPTLAPYEGGDATASTDQSPAKTLAVEDIEAKPETRAAIRIAALARQWQVAGRNEGYLLTGDALEEAKAFRDSDPEIRVFIEASEE